MDRRLGRRRAISDLLDQKDSLHLFARCLFLVHDISGRSMALAIHPEAVFAHCIDGCDLRIDRVRRRCGTVPDRASNRGRGFETCH